MARWPGGPGRRFSAFQIPLTCHIQSPVHIEFTFEDSLQLEMFSMMCADDRELTGLIKKIGTGLRGWSPATQTRILQLLQVKKFIIAISTIKTKN